MKNIFDEHYRVSSALARTTVPYKYDDVLKCVSCGTDTPKKSGQITKDTVTKRQQFFCLECLNMSHKIMRKER